MPSRGLLEVEISVPIEKPGTLRQSPILPGFTVSDEHGPVALIGVMRRKHQKDRFQLETSDQGRAVLAALEVHDGGPVAPGRVRKALRTIAERPEIATAGQVQGILGQRSVGTRRRDLVPRSGAVSRRRSRRRLETGSWNPVKSGTQ